MKSDAAAIKNIGVDYGESPVGEIPDLGDDFKSAYVPVKSFKYCLIQMLFQVDPSVPIVLLGKQFVSEEYRKQTQLIKCTSHTKNRGRGHSAGILNENVTIAKKTRAKCYNV